MLPPQPRRPQPRRPSPPRKRPPRPVTLATDAMTDLDAEAHRNSLEKIFPRLGESDTTEAILALLG